MNISPVSFKIFKDNINKNNSSNNSQKNVQNYPIVSYAADTVAFSGKKNIFEQNLDSVNQIIEEKIVPLIEDGKDLHIKTGKIGYALQEKVRFFGENERDLIGYKFRLFGRDDKNLKAEKFAKYLEKYDEYTDNRRHFDFYASMAKIPEYKSDSNIQNKVESFKNLFEKPEDVKKLEPLVEEYNSVRNSLSSELEKITLKNTNKPMYDMMIEMNEKKTTAIYYVMLNPYNASAKLLKNRDEVSKSIHNNKMSVYERLKQIEALQHDADSILNTKHLFYENTGEISDFVENNKEFVKILPKDFEIKSAYTALKKQCDVAEKHALYKMNEFFDKQYTDKGVVFDFPKLEGTLKNQKTALKELSKLMD